MTYISYKMPKKVIVVESVQKARETCYKYVDVFLERALIRGNEELYKACERAYMLLNLASHMNPLIWYEICDKIKCYDNI